MCCCVMCEKYTVARVLRDHSACSFGVQQSERSLDEVAIKMILQNIGYLSPDNTASHLQQHRHKNLKPQNMFSIFQNVSYQLGYDSSLMNVHSDLNM